MNMKKIEDPSEWIWKEIYDPSEWFENEYEKKSTILVNDSRMNMKRNLRF
jgi:Fe-S cluster biosynthesis and repair protein YggX